MDITLSLDSDVNTVEISVSVPNFWVVEVLRKTKFRVSKEYY